MELIFAAIIGLVFGSAANGIIYRIHVGTSWCRGRSSCPHCGTTLAWWELIPLFSFGWQKGRCRHCRTAIGWQYPLVEAASAIAGIVAVSIGGWTLDGMILFGWLWVLTMIFVYDLRYQQIPDVVTLPAIVATVVIHGWQGVPWLTIVVGGLVGAGWFAAQYLLSRGKWVGDGDIRLGGLMGVLLGWPVVIVALVVGYITGAIAGVYLLASGRAKRSDAIAFGPFLVIGTVVALLWGPELVAWYRLLIGL